MKKVFIASFVLYAVCCQAKAETAYPELISISSEGLPANLASYGSTISGDGRLVVFSSAASNLVTGDNNDAIDIFVRDRKTGITERISINQSGEEANAASGIDVYVSGTDYAPAYMECANPLTTYPLNCDAFKDKGKAKIDSLAVSADGRYVAFSSRASNLVSGDTNQKQDIFVADRQTKTIKRISNGQNSSEANGRSYRPTMSRDGRFIAYLSAASNLVADDSNGQIDVFVSDQLSGQTERVNLDSAGQQADSGAWEARISDGGQFVVFTSNVTNWGVIQGASKLTNVFVKDRLTGATNVLKNKRIAEYSNTVMPDISHDGRNVVFQGVPFQYLGTDCFSDRYEYSYLQKLKTRKALPLQDDAYGVYVTNVYASCWINAQLPSYIGIEPGMRIEQPAMPVDSITLSRDGRYVFSHGMRYTLGTGKSELAFYDPANPVNDWPAKYYLGGVSDNGSLIAFTTDSAQRIADDNNGVADILLLNTEPAESDLSVELFQQELSNNGAPYLNLSLKVSNKSDVAINQIKVNAKTPAALKLLSTTFDAGSCIPGKQINCSIETLPAWSEVTLTTQMLIKKSSNNVFITALVSSVTQESKLDKANNKAKLQLKIAP
ncbi:MAG: hypothetical protein ABL919_09575 [Methylococcales bacterium]|nr:hypothetical protein [Methylococcaceae bacterium]